ncbi:FecCD family ABC transporter permease [Roseovarius indicus]|uniref:FecCD family ABC transporter permease n=1 Tax=Roseovarius indicus TaxID=540747 RepID=UPI0032EB9893
MTAAAGRHAALPFLLAMALLVLAVWAMGVGASDIPMGRVAQALWAPGTERADIVVMQVRLPRVLAGVSAGAALAVAGAIMQAVTGNPLAEPGIMGVNAGAAFAVVCGLAFLGLTAVSELIWMAFVGAGAAAVLVYGLGTAGRSGPTPLKLVLAGVVVTTFLGSVTTTILLFDAQTLDTVRFWTVGSLKGRQLGDVVAVLPYLAVALVAALVCGAQFTAMSLGADVARGLGQNAPVWRAIAALLVVGLAGSAVAIAGPVAFVGLVVPHIVRMCIGADYRRILPLCLLGGAALTLCADTLPRALSDRDIPVGITLAVLGAPFFIWLARRHGGAGA